MEEEAFQALSKKGMKKPAAARPVKTMKKPAASNATSSAKASTTIFGCLRCRGASKGCDTCIQPNFTGLRLPGRKAWKKYMAQTGGKTSLSKGENQQQTQPTYGVKRVPGSNLIFKLCEPSSSPGRVIFRLKSFHNKPTKKLFR